MSDKIKRWLRILSRVMLFVGIAFLLFAINNPQASWPAWIPSDVIYGFYNAYVIITLVLLLLQAFRIL